jgi:hypothetical protein
VVSDERGSVRSISAIRAECGSGEPTLVGSTAPVSVADLGGSHSNFLCASVTRIRFIGLQIVLPPLDVLNMMTGIDELLNGEHQPKCRRCSLCFGFEFLVGHVCIAVFTRYSSHHIHQGPYDGECEKEDDQIIHVGWRDDARVGAKLGELFVQPVRFVSTAKERLQHTAFSSTRKWTLHSGPMLYWSFGIGRLLLDSLCVLIKAVLVQYQFGRVTLAIDYESDLRIDNL